MKLYFHPRSSFSQKVLLALYEKDIPFTPVLVNPLDPNARAELATISPFGKIPLLVLDDGWKIPESTIIVEYLDAHFPSGTRLIPADRDLARQTRFHDRVADLYLKDPLRQIFFETEKPEDARDAKVLSAARQRLDTLFGVLDRHLAERRWLVGDEFTLADCSLIACFASARRLHPHDRWEHLAAYAARARERASVRRLEAEVAPYLAPAAAA